MATKLYFHAASNALSGTFPAGEQSFLTPTWSATGATTLRTMTTTIGVSQASLAGTTAASTTLQRGFVGFFCSAVLNGAQTIGSGAFSLNVADSQSNTNSTFFVNYVNVYVWRPSGGTIVGTIFDGSLSGLGGLVATSASSEQVTNDPGVPGSAVNAADGDVIVCELWGSFTQGMATAYTATVFYDGTTENTTENAVVSNHASYIQFAETLAFKGPAAVLTAAVGSFTLSGQAAGLKRGLKVTAAVGSFALSGQAATLTHGYRMVAAVGSFTRTGQAATLTATRKVIAAVGAFALSGQSAALNKGQRLTAAAGSFTLSGQAAGLKYGRKVTAAVRAFSLSGQTARLARSFNALTAAVGSFTLTGKDATLTKSGTATAYTLTAGVGSFSLSGQAAGLIAPASIVSGPPPGGGRGKRKPIKFQGRFYDPDKDRYQLARDVQEFLEEKPSAPVEAKPVKVRVQKKTVRLPASPVLTAVEITDFEAIAREINLQQQAIEAYVAHLRAVLHQVELEDEEDAIALLLAA